MMTSIKDAQYAVNVQKGGTADIQACKFMDNNFAIRTAPEGTGNYAITLLGNTFKGSEAGLKPAYTNQTPAPGIKGFTGIYAKDLTAGLSIDKDAIFGLENEFSNLHYGILAENTNVTVRDAVFTDIIKETRPSGYPGPLFTGTAIHLTRGSANVKGSFTGIAPGPVLMDNCYTGVNVLGGSIDVGGCEMGNMTNGIVAGAGTNKAYSIFWNNIAASERGISVYYQSGLPGQSSINNNIVHIAGNANGVGIATGGQEMFPQQEGFVANNHVTMDEGATGIQIGVANRIKVTQNTVNLAGSGTLFGIKMEGGDRNTLNCNTVTSSGSGNNDGIYAIHAGRASVLCNLTDGPARGLHFEGMLGGRNKADISGNTMDANSAAGLVLGTDAVIGGQPHRGNKFEGVGAMAGAGAQLHSLFTVDVNENADFLPFPLFPPSWFENIAEPAPSYQCVPGTTCPLPAIVSDYPLDIKIVKGELGGVVYGAANQWLAQRRFYERVLEEGNPYPGNSDVSAFLSQAQTNGLSGYANVQTGIRQLGTMNEGARATAAGNLLTLNGALSGTASYQVNEKTVNQLFLQSAAIGNIELSEAQVSTLEIIAALCPLSDGEAVLRARALLELVQESPAVYDDFVICYGGERSINKLKKSGSSGQSLKLYPNPASDAVTIEYSGLGSSDQRLLLFNVFGQAALEIALPDGHGSVQVSLSALPAGVYWYALLGVGHISGKLVVHR